MSAYLEPQIPDLRGMLKSFRRVAYDVLDDQVGRYTDDERDRFVRRLGRQQFHSLRVYPLSEAYLQKKRRKQLDIRTHFATRTMVRGIRVFRVRRGRRGHLYHIGFERTALARDENNRTIPVPLYRLAMILERGSLSNGLPPRATWAPNLVVMRQRASTLRRRLPLAIIREARRRDPRLRSVLRLR